MKLLIPVLVWTFLQGQLLLTGTVSSSTSVSAEPESPERAQFICRDGDAVTKSTAAPIQLVKDIDETDLNAEEEEEDDDGTTNYPMILVTPTPQPDMSGSTTLHLKIITVCIGLIVMGGFVYWGYKLCRRWRLRSIGRIKGGYRVLDGYDNSRNNGVSEDWSSDLNWGNWADLATSSEGPC